MKSYQAFIEQSYPFPNPEFKYTDQGLQFHDISLPTAHRKISYPIAYQLLACHERAYRHKPNAFLPKPSKNCATKENITTAIAPKVPILPLSSKKRYNKTSILKRPHNMICICLKRCTNKGNCPQIASFSVMDTK